MTEKERDTILLSLQEKFNQLDGTQKSMLEKVNQIDGMQGKINQLDGTQKSMLEKINQLDSTQKSMLEKINQLDSTQKSMLEKVNKIDSMEQDIKELKKDMRNISRSVAVMEHVYGKKIQTLIDLQVALLEKFDLFQKKLDSHDNILEMHSDRIWNLESKLGII